jgi:hypothetical protein
MFSTLPATVLRFSGYVKQVNERTSQNQYALFTFTNLYTEKRTRFFRAHMTILSKPLSTYLITHLLMYDSRDSCCVKSLKRHRECIY